MKGDRCRGVWGGGGETPGEKGMGTWSEGWRNWPGIKQHLKGSMKEER